MRITLHRSKHTRWLTLAMLVAYICSFSGGLVAADLTQKQVYNLGINGYDTIDCSVNSGVVINDLTKAAAKKVVSDALKANPGSQIGYALYNAGGSLEDQLNDTNENYGASITKAMLLVMYLNQIGTGTLSKTDIDDLTLMIEQSDNAAANRIYSRINNAAQAVPTFAQSIGMTGFQMDTSDPLYILGQSMITASDFAQFFSRIDVYIPATGDAGTVGGKPHATMRDFGLDLLSHLAPADQKGLLQASLPQPIYSKEGWKQEGPTWVVNQAAQFKSGGVTYGIAVTVSGVKDQATGEQIIQNLVSALVQPQGTTGFVGTGTLPGIIPDPYNSAFTQGAKKFNVAPALIAAIFTEENFTASPTDQLASIWAGFPKRHPDPNSGWPTNQFQTMGAFQFIPSTWAAEAVDGNGDGVKDAQNIWDAAASAAHYLSQGGATVDKPPASWQGAIFSYNHAQWYVDAVMTYYNFYSTGDTSSAPPSAIIPTSAGAACGLPPLASTVTCNGTVPGLSGVRQSAVCIAKNELARWKGGQMRIGFRACSDQSLTSTCDSYAKYTENTDELWCADFVSWVYKQANYPIGTGGNSWRVPAVVTIMGIGQHGGKWNWHLAGVGGYTPRPGDLIIHEQGGESHVNIVIGVSGHTLDIIGGDQHGGGGADRNIVSEYQDSGFSGVDNITGYVSPD